ncbi:MAG TPA: zinc ribbon domain-containing protein [Gemmatimonadota bacterium]|nr:zinc ribbon domain-containing protein [Gemmatimonadota bacterium]
MPRYDYVCHECGAPFEVRASMSAYSEGLSPSCPECGSQDTERTFTAVNVLTGSQGSASPSRGCSPSGFG